ncbi:beta-lactamase family protein [Aeromicrobium sp. YIM 150415]|uniref:serine hydrolase domain-containing protein n=1 Tax=Aeromicrobium sp. YIM 150415 TaxID=2803912 RepID=UPI0019661CEB|nr:serine hydrolase domain-containing protein [Aeromicrobium sp. YIM 150415]MBM9464696.1 beta-lactamase family protein [Aeromicrobium sp. YIM 150415]
MRRSVVVTIVTAAAVGLVLGAWLRPGAGSIGTGSPTHGDEGLARDVTERLPSTGVHALSVAVVTPEGEHTATIGAPLDGTFEIGSITKAITGMVYADMVERGEVGPGTTLGELLDIGDVPAADITLEELAQQRSGLPRLAGGAGMFVRAAVSSLLARNPYHDTAEETTAALAEVEVGEKEPLYSNFGFAVLGHALAAAAETTYPELVRERIAEPLDLGSLAVPPSSDELGPDAVQGRDAAGRAQEAWADSGSAPAGGLRASAADMARLATAILDGQAPGMAALDPVADFGGGQRIGAAWITEEIGGRTVTWHNGATGGFRSWIGVDRDRGTAAYISGATTADLDAIGLALLREAGR